MLEVLHKITFLVYKVWRWAVTMRESHHLRPHLEPCALLIILIFLLPGLGLSWPNTWHLLPLWIPLLGMTFLPH